VLEFQDLTAVERSVLGVAYTTYAREVQSQSAGLFTAVPARLLPPRYLDYLTGDFLRSGHLTRHSFEER
jgi:hypothetical protein